MQSIILVILISSTSGVLGWLTSDTWIKKPDTDVSKLLFWKDVYAVSRIGCVLQCQMSHSRGCGYNKFTGKCLVYVDGGNTTKWIPQDGFEYFVPLRAGSWKDMRHFGYNFALLMPSGNNTWAESRSLCDSLGSRPYVMDNREKRHALKLFLKMQGISTTSFWLGCNDIAAEGKWVWESGKPVDDFWLHGEPNNSKGSQDCGALVFEKNKFGIDDDECNDTSHSICELVYPDI